MSKWLDAEGTFRKGRFDGEALEEVVVEDPGYLEWLLEHDFDLDADDRAAIEDALVDAGA
jgi:hypothetical protein